MLLWESVSVRALVLVLELVWPSVSDSSLAGGATIGDGSVGGRGTSFGGWPDDDDDDDCLDWFWSGLRQ